MLVHETKQSSSCAAPIIRHEAQAAFSSTYLGAHVLVTRQQMVASKCIQNESLRPDFRPSLAARPFFAFGRSRHILGSVPSVFLTPLVPLLSALLFGRLRR